MLVQCVCNVSTVCVQCEYSVCTVCVQCEYCVCVQCVYSVCTVRVQCVYNLSTVCVKCIIYSPKFSLFYFFIKIYSFFTVCDLCGGLVAQGRQIYGRVGKIRLSRTGSSESFFGSQLKQSKQPLTEEICLLSEVTTYIYFLIEIDKKSSLFYLMHPANINSHENRVFL